ncbi:MAG: hypothetical protein NTZ51_10755 [Proteobacteria bacterium]|nr:hypothetical protein [Pseudomonadota bacterium]
MEVEGEDFWFAPVEYVILRKLEYYREGGSDKHLRDISSILSVSAEQIDFKELEKRINKNTLNGEWGKAKGYNL